MNNSCYAFLIYTFCLHFCPIRIEFILLIDSEYFISFIWVWVFMLDTIIAVSWAELYCGALGFYNSKNLNSIGTLSFLINFIGMIFEVGNETREKIWSDFGAEQKWRAEQKESGFCS